MHRLKPAGRRPDPARGRAVVACLVFVASFSLACLGIGGLIDRVPGVRSADEVVRAKLRHYARHKEDYDLVMVGSSRVYRQLSPRAFDRRTAELGLPTHSFNLGIPAMRLLEISERVHWVLDQKASALRWLLIEVEPVRILIPGANVGTARVVSWHTPRTFTAGLRVIAATGDRSAVAWDAAWNLLRHLVLHESNVGAAVPALRAVMGREDEEALGLALGFYGDGFLPLEREREVKYLERRRQLLAHPEGFRQKLAELTAVLLDPIADEASQEVIWGMIDHARAAGVLPILILTPGFEPSHGLEIPGARGPLPNLLAYNDPMEYPHYYRLENRFDRAHLDTETSRFFTLRVAADFTRLLESQAPD